MIATTAALESDTFDDDADYRNADDALFNDDTSPKTPQLRQDDVIKRAALRDNILKTVVLYSGVFILSLQWGVIGPTLPDLEQLTGSSMTFISLILTGRNIASLIGCTMAGFMIDRYNNWLLLGSAEILLGVLFALSTWSHELVVLAVCLIPSGIAAGFYDTGVNVAVMRTFMNKPAPWIQAMDFIDAVGIFFGPLLAQPFVSQKVAIPRIDGVESYNDSLMHQLMVDDTVMTFKYTAVHDLESESDLINDDVTVTQHSEQSNQDDVTMSKVAFVYLIVGILLVLMASVHFCIFCRKKKHSNEDYIDTGDEVSDVLENSADGSIPLLILPLLFLTCFAYYFIETGYGYYLMTFCVTELSWSKNQGMVINSAFWAANICGNLIGIIIVKYVRPRTVLIFDQFLCLTAQVTLACYLSYHPAVIWCCTLVTGFCLSTMFTSVFSWTQENYGMSGRVNGLLMVGMATGEITSPAVIGILIDNSGPISWAYCMVAAAVLCTVSFLLIQLPAKKSNVNRDRS